MLRTPNTVFFLSFETYYKIPYLAPHREKRFKSRPTPYQTTRPTHSHSKHEIQSKFVNQDADNDSGSEADGSLFGWEEEATLLSDMMEEE